MTPPQTTPCPTCGRHAAFSRRIREGSKTDKAFYFCPQCRRVTVVLDLLAIGGKT